MKNKLIVISFIFTGMWAQGQVNSLYSSYGLGVVQLRDNNLFAGMGGATMALKSGYTISDLNPASYAGINSEQLMMELAFKGSSLRYISGSNHVTGSNLTFEKAALGINLFDKVGAVVGLRRYSSVSYNSMVAKSLEGSENIMSDYIEGTGGMNLFYIGSGFQIVKNLSLGLTGGYMFGSLRRTDEMVTDAGYATIFENNVFHNKLYWNAGMQYDIKMGKGLLTLGGMVQPEVTLNRVRDFYIRDSDDETLFSEEGHSMDDFRFPLQWGAGLAFKKGKSTLSLDMVAQQWKDVAYRGSNFYAQDLKNYALGYKYTKLRRTWYGIREGASFMAGLQYENGYLVIKDQQYPSMLFSLGLSLPSLNKGLLYSMVFRGGQRGTSSTNGFKEKFFDVTFTFGLFNQMNRKGYKYD